MGDSALLTFMIMQSYPRNTVMKRSLDIWSDRFRDYCNVDDPACAGGSMIAVHYDYFVGSYWPFASAKFVRDRLNLD